MSAKNSSVNVPTHAAPKFVQPDSAKLYAGLNDELRGMILEAEAARQYRASYNSRADVIAKRQAYNKKRQAEIKAGLELLAKAKK